MTTMPDDCVLCHDEEGRPREVPISVTRWTPSGTETTFRCPLCGWQDTRPDTRAALHPTAAPPNTKAAGRPGGDDRPHAA